MAEFKQIIDDALDILKFDGAVQDTLAELREKWGAQVPALLDERFDAIGIQYMKLPHEKGTAALGQELSAFGWALYNLDDEDEYGSKCGWLPVIDKYLSSQMIRRSIWQQTTPTYTKNTRRSSAPTSFTEFVISASAKRNGFWSMDISPARTVEKRPDGIKSD